MSIKWTPKMMILWVANMQLKGIAELIDFNLDLDLRTAYVHTRLYGEEESIEVYLEDFAIVSERESHHLMIQQAQSNRPWLNNLLALIIGKAWKIPVIPEFKAHIELISELFKVESQQQPEQPELEDREIREEVE
jgi:hypothetical protein